MLKQQRCGIGWTAPLVIQPKPRKSRGSVYAPGERVEYSDGTVMIADAKGSLRRVPR